MKKIDKSNATNKKELTSISGCHLLSTQLSAVAVDVVVMSAGASSQILYTLQESLDTAKKKSQHSWALSKKYFWGPEVNHSCGKSSTPLLHPSLFVISGCHWLLLHCWEMVATDVVVVVVVSVAPLSSQWSYFLQSSSGRKKSQQVWKSKWNNPFTPSHSGGYVGELLQPSAFSVSGCHIFASQPV